MTSSLSIRQIASHYLLTPQGFYKHPLLTLDAATGQILRVEQYGSSLDSTAGVEFYSGILSPGFVNAHCHSELSYLRGKISPNGGYAAFAASMAAVRGDFTDEQRRDAWIEADRAMWEQGISVVADIVNDRSSFETKGCSPIFYRSFAEVFGLKQSNIELCRELAALPYTTLTPHSVYSIQQSDFQAVCDTNPSVLTIHFKESEAEEQLFAGYGSLAKWYKVAGFECDFLDYGSPAQRLVASVPPTQSVMLVHNSYVTQRDIDIIMSHFTAPVYWVLCPRSNRYISGAITDVVRLLDSNGLNICIGTDSLASNSSLSVVEELKCFADMPLEKLLTWATFNGAAALGVEPRGLINITGADLDKMAITSQTKVKRVL